MLETIELYNDRFEKEMQERLRDIELWRSDQLLLYVNIPKTGTNNLAISGFGTKVW